MMHFFLCLCTLWLSITSHSQADTAPNVSVKIPFGLAATWASSVQEVQDCREGDCEEETKFGVLQALNYAMNNAKLAIMHGFEEENGGKYLKNLDKLSVELAEIENMNPEGKKWKKKFKKILKNTLKLFDDEQFTKKLKESAVTMEIPSNDIGLTWRTESVKLPVYSHEDAKKGLAELKFAMNNGVEIPIVGFGTWQTEGQECTDAVVAALKVGYRHIDTAQGYENEAEVGKGIEEAIKQGIIKSREEIFLVTKLSEARDYGKNKTIKRINKQLELLQTDYLDVYMLHGPESVKKNKAAWKGMFEMLKKGKIKALGISNFESIKVIKAFAQNMAYKPNYIQNKFSIYSPGGQTVDRESMLQNAENRGLAFIGYSINNPWPFVLPPREDPHVIEIAKRYNKTPAQIVNRWALQLNVLIIPKSSNVARIEENAGVVEFAIEESDMRLLNGLSVLYQSSTDKRPAFIKDVYGLFAEETEDAGENVTRDEL